MNTYTHTDNDIAPNTKPLEVVGGLFSNYNLDKIKIRPNLTLFEKSPQEKKDLLIQRRCIVCTRKLRIDRKGNGRCVSKQKDKFFIRKEVLDKYICQK